MDNILDHETRHANPELYLASSGQRLANYILDRIGSYAVAFFIISFVDDLGNDDLSDIGAILLLLSMLSYWVLFEYIFGKTPAKFLTGTKVVTKFGYRPSLLKIIGRTLCRLIPFEQFSFLGTRAIGWHDSISGTRVVRDEFELEDTFV